MGVSTKQRKEYNLMEEHLCFKFPCNLKRYI